MVLGVCRRALADPDDADDAFQATFLILVRKAGSVRVDDSLGRWLYGVSRKVAARARAVAARRPTRRGDGLEAVEARPRPTPTGSRSGRSLDEELARLPEPYRSAIVLCDLDGLTHEEAARDLRCPVGTVKSRQARGRARLRDRLERRGLATLARMVLAPIVPAGLAEADGPGGLGDPSRARRRPGWSRPRRSCSLGKGLKAMTGIKLKLAAAAALSIGVIGAGAGVMARQDGGDRVPTPPAGADARPSTTEEAPIPVELRAELNRARRRLDAAKAVAKDPADPAIVRARAELDRLNAAADRIGAILAETLGKPRPGPASSPTNPGTATAKGARTPGSPARELAKVSLPDYVVEPPDILLVEVLEALPGRPITGERLIRPDGTIGLGFYGDLYVAGLTLTEVKAKVTRHLRQYLKDETLGLSKFNAETGRAEPIDPTQSNRVFVDVTAYNSKVYYVQGEVGSPGGSRSPATRPSSTPSTSPAALLPTAAKGRIRLVRPAPPGTGASNPCRSTSKPSSRGATRPPTTSPSRRPDRRRPRPQGRRTSQPRPRGRRRGPLPGPSSGSSTRSSRPSTASPNLRHRRPGRPIDRSTRGNPA